MVDAVKKPTICGLSPIRHRFIFISGECVNINFTQSVFHISNLPL